MDLISGRTAVMRRSKLEAALPQEAHPYQKPAKVMRPLLQDDGLKGWSERGLGLHLTSYPIHQGAFAPPHNRV